MRAWGRPGVALEKLSRWLKVDDSVIAGGDIEFDCYIPAIIHMCNFRSGSCVAIGVLCNEISETIPREIIGVLIDPFGSRKIKTEIDKKGLW